MPDVVKFLRQLGHDLRNHLNAAELQSAYVAELAVAENMLLRPGAGQDADLDPEMVRERWDKGAEVNASDLVAGAGESYRRPAGASALD